jgi:hypothetical protein
VWAVSVCDGPATYPDENIYLGSNVKYITQNLGYSYEYSGIPLAPPLLSAGLSFKKIVLESPTVTVLSQRGYQYQSGLAPIPVRDIGFVDLPR